jgi:cytochrome c553
MKRSLALGFTILLAALAGCSRGPEVCSTDSAWLEGDEESPLMHPGGDCIGCHTREGEGPRFQIAGTVMNDLKDDTDCNGIAGVTVQITDANNQVFTMTTNPAGNFFLEPTASAVALPFKAKLSYKGRERVMMTPQSVGACASCHTTTGANGAPGRILAP